MEGNEIERNEKWNSFQLLPRSRAKAIGLLKDEKGVDRGYQALEPVSKYMVKTKTK